MELRTHVKKSQNHGAEDPCKKNQSRGGNHLKNPETLFGVVECHAFMRRRRI